MGGAKRDRDRATEAFRKWARAGCPDADEMKMGTRKYDADIRACAAVFAMLKEESMMAKRGAGRMNTASGEIMHAVRCVYMEEPTRPMRRAEVTMKSVFPRRTWP